MVYLPKIGFNDLASSWKCGSNVHAIFCDDFATNCDYNRTQSIAGRIYNPVSGSNDRLTTLVLKKYDPKKTPAITLFEHDSCIGRS